jgi:LPXTG-site transpeptidase (sortase) family protein
VLFSFLYGKAYIKVFSWELKDFFNINSSLEKEIVYSNTPLKINKLKPEDNINLASFNFEITPPDNRIILEKMNKNIPIVEISPQNLVSGNLKDFEQDILKGLESGVVRYPLTAKPGEIGNVVLTGHSSYYSWAAGNFKDAFVTMHNIEVGDLLIMYYNQHKYVYKVFEKKVISPEDLSVLEQSTNEKTLTTITCTPIGTAKNRLVHIAKLIED